MHPEVSKPHVMPASMKLSAQSMIAWLCSLLLAMLMLGKVNRVSCSLEACAASLDGLQGMFWVQAYQDSTVYG